MTNEELFFFLKVSGSVILVLFGVAGWAIRSMATSVIVKMEEISAQLQAINISFSATKQDVDTSKKEIDNLRDRADDTDDFKTQIFRDYKLEKK